MGVLSAGACAEYGMQVDCPYFGDMLRAVVEGSVDKLAALHSRGGSLTRLLRQLHALSFFSIVFKQSQI
jgi:hypothetical protein